MALPQRRAAFEPEPFDAETDVPAAVLCARCGVADCPGCELEITQSGIVSIVPWERPGAASERLWTTARLATLDAERFFETLPDGPIGPALAFAVAAELAAVGAASGLALGLAGLAVPGWVAHLARSSGSSVLLGGLVFVLLLVGAHAAHGVALAWGSGPRALRRALRFGLYEAGWDVVLGPIGFVVLLLTRGRRAVRALFRESMGLPTRAARAFLRGALRVEGAAASSPIRASLVAAVISTLLVAFALVTGLILLIAF